MKLLKQIIQYRVYRRLILSYLLLIVMSVVIVSTILFVIFSTKTVEEIDNFSKQMLSQVSYTESVVYKQIQDVSSQLLLDKDVTAFFYENDVNKVTDYRAYLVLSKVQSVYPFIANIGLYNFTNGEYVDTIGLKRDPMSEAPAKRFLGFYPRISYEEGESPLKLLTFRIVPEWQSHTGTPRFALLLDLQESYIQKTILSINVSKRDANTFVMDASGKVLSHSNPDYFMSDFSSNDYVQRILKSSGTQGSFAQTINKQANLITYVRSPTLDWFFVTVQPYHKLLSGISTLRNWTWIIGVLLILVGAAISLFLTRNMYNPIRTLVERVTENQGRAVGQGQLLKNDEYALLSYAFLRSKESAELLELRMNRSKQVMKSSLILSLLKGIDHLTVEQIVKEWGDHLKGPYFTVILFKVDALESFKEMYSPFDRELIRFAVGNIAQEVLGKEYKNDVAITDEEFVILLQSEHKGSDRLYLMLTEIQDTIRTYYRITVSASIGEWCESFIHLKDSYQSAQNYISYRLFYGYNCIVDAERTARNREIELRYPSSIEKKLIDAVKLCNDKLIQNEIKNWSNYVSQGTPVQAIQHTNFLLLALIREFEHVSEWLDVDTGDLYVYFNNFQSVGTLDGTIIVLTDVCSRIVTVIEENKQNVAMMKNLRIIEEVKKLVTEKYAGSELSLEYAANHVGLSTGYLGKLFKNLANSMFNDYVSTIRIDRAKHLLLTMNETVAEIGGAVGIPGAAYFATVFKKHVGMSPSQYRENQKKS